MESYRVGIIGLGLIAWRLEEEPGRVKPHIRVAASRSRERLQAFGERYGG